MAKYTIRPPFAVHLQKIENTQQPGGAVRKTVREQSYFHGLNEEGKPLTVELSDDEAFVHMHKLEPFDDAAKKLFGEYHAEQEQQRRLRAATDGNAQPIAAQVAKAVVDALVAAGVMPAAKGAKA